MNFNKNSRLLATFLGCVRILPERDRRRYFLVILLQAVLGFLDLIGVVVMGLIGAIAIRGVQSQPISPRIRNVLEFFNLSELTFQSQVAILGLLAASILVFRTLTTMFFTRKILRFLATKSAQISSNLFSKFVNQDLYILQKNSAAELHYILGPGVSAVSVGILGTASILVSDLSSLVIIGIGLFAIDALSAMLSVILFGSIALVLYLKLHKKAQVIGEQLGTLEIRGNQIINETVNGYREIYTHDRMAHYARELSTVKTSLSLLNAENTFIPNIGKYVIEISIIIGAAGIAAFQFILNDATHAVASLAIFLAAGTRIAPALLRLQQSLVGIKSHLGIANLTLNALQETESMPLLAPLDTNILQNQKNFGASISIRDLKFSYESSDNFEIDIESLDFVAGETVAIVGPSGGGKSSLIDLILGVNSPQSGKILISDLPPKLAVQNWPGKISYVPQDVLLIRGSVAQNVALGYLPEEIDYERIAKVLHMAQLEEFLQAPESFSGIPSPSQSLILSGGQRQRLGIARALYTSPKLLILDEATSALDGITESAISLSLNKIKGEVTVILIAHRLSTVVNANRVIYVDKGRVLAHGTFDEVRSEVPNFNQQAEITGL